MTRLTHGIPKPLREGAIFLSIALVTYSWFTYSGPYRWLAEQQMSLFGQYHPVLTGLWLLIAMIVAWLAVLQLPRRLGLFGPASQSLEQHHSDTQAVADRWRKRQPYLTTLGVGAVLTFLGGRDLLRAEQGRTLERIDLSALEAGKRPKSTWIEAVGGTAAWDASMGWEEGMTKKTFIPVLSSVWKTGQPVSLILQVSTAKVDRMNPDQHSFQGASMPDGLPTPVTAAFADAGIDTSHALVLGLDAPPTKKEGIAKALVGIGVLAMLAGAVLAALAFRRGRVA